MPEKRSGPRDHDIAQAAEKMSAPTDSWIQVNRLIRAMAAFVALGGPPSDRGGEIVDFGPGSVVVLREAAAAAIGQLVDPDEATWFASSALPVTFSDTGERLFAWWLGPPPAGTSICAVEVDYEIERMQAILDGARLVSA